MTMLTLIKQVESKKGSRYGLYRCQCGNEKIIRISAVTSGSTKSCGCHRRNNMSVLGKNFKTHGQTGTYLYWLWQDKIKEHSVWNTFDEFYDWIKNKWTKGLTLEPNQEGFYDESCNLVKGVDIKNKKRSQTCLDKYGYESALQSPEIKEKIKKTNIKKYGVENPAKTDIVKQHIIENNRKKYGVDYPQQLIERRQKQKQYAVEKVGFDTEMWAKQSGISRSAFCQRVNKYGFDKAITLTRGESGIEAIIHNLLDDLNISFITGKKLDKYFPDFIIENHKLIIETDGLYWHSDAINHDYLYHRKKLDIYESLGYRAMFFRENEIENKLDIISSVIQNHMKKSYKIYARKCNIIELNKECRRIFFNQNHLMGRGRGDCYALEYNNQIVCALQFTNRNGLVDISRFCNVLNTSVIGGYSRLIAHIIRNNDVNKIQTFVDRRYGTGDYLYSMGFNKITDRLSFVWVKNDKTFHRLKYRGNSGYEYGLYKLWDCGQVKFEKSV